MKLVFFGTDNFALHILEVLQKDFEVVAVVTTPDAKVGRKQILTPSPVALLTEELHIPLYKPESLKNNASFAADLRALGADVFVVVVYGKIIPKDILAIPPKGVINVHPSLLPLYRGPSPIRTPLRNGDTETGVSIMCLDDEVDHGPLLAQERVHIDADDNNVTLTEKLAQTAAPLLVRALTEHVSGSITPSPQDHTKATFTSLTTKEDGKVDWNRTAQEIYNQFRAFYDWPQIWTTWNGQKLKIVDCSVVDATCSQQPGTVLFGGQVACGGGTVLQIHSLQLEGKKETAIGSFLNGYPQFIGSSLS